MKRKFLIAFTAIATVLCLSFGLVACNGNSDTTDGGSQTPDGGSQTPEHVHTFTAENVCSGCGDAWEFTDGLEYELDTKTDTYTVKGIGSASGDIVFPYGHEGKAVTAIKERAFRGCEELTGVTIPACVTSIGDRAFYGCTELASIQVSEGNTVYRSEVNSLIETETNILLCGCKNSKIPSGVTAIAEDAFYGQAELKNVEIPNTVTTIGDESFSYCLGLTSITIPESVTKIGSFVFVGCDGVEHIEVASGNPVYRSEQDCLIEKETNTMLYGCKNSKVPEGVTAVDGAFRELQTITSIELPASVTAIGFGTFQYSSLTSLTIKGKLTSIGTFAFAACDMLTEIIFNGTVAEWQSIEFDPDYCDPHTADFTVTCTDGTITKNGVITMN